MASRVPVTLTVDQLTWLINAGKWVLTDPFCRQELNQGQEDALRSGVRALEAAAPPPAPQD